MACLLVLSFSCGSFADDLSVIAADIRALTKQGNLKQALELSTKYENKSEDIAMQYGKISLLLGRESQGLEIFHRLSQSPALNENQKENLERFLSQFELSLKKRLKKARDYQNSGQCDEAQILYKSLLNYQSTQGAAKKGLNRCEPSLMSGIQDAVKGRLFYRTGYDSNISLDNEDTLSTNSDVLAGAFQKLSLSLMTDTRNSSPLWLQGGYNFYGLDYFSDKSKIYDQQSHRLYAKAGGRIDKRWRWQVPVTYRDVMLNDQNYASYASIKTRISYRDSKWIRYFEYGFQNKSYADIEDSERDGDYQDFAMGLRSLNSNNRLFAKLEYRTFDGPSDGSDVYHRTRLFVSATSMLPPWFYGTLPRLQLSYDLSEKSYQSIDAALVDSLGSEYEERRQDLKHRLSTELKLLKSDWQVMFAFHFQRRESNLPIYQYNRNITELGVQYRF
jgi:hypothetical protein